MRTGLTKKQKTTVIYFDEHSRIIEEQPHNTDLKKRLTAFAAKHPQCCRQTDDDEQGGLTFEIGVVGQLLNNAAMLVKINHGCLLLFGRPCSHKTS